MSKVYDLLLIVKELQDSWRSFGKNAAEAIRGIVERYALSSINRDGSFEWLRVVDPRYEKLIQELSESNKIKPETATKVVNDLMSAATKYHSLPDRKDLPKWYVQDGILYVGDKLSLPFNQSFLKVYARVPENEVIKAWLRIQCTLPLGQQWALPDTWFKAMENLEIPIKVEAFASPFNRVSPYYCSAFNEDEILGSLGSFFNMNLDLFPTNDEPFGIEVNPPFDEEILLKAVFKCKDLMDEANLKDKKLAIFFNGPGWSDAKYVSEIESRFKTQRYELPPKTHSYIDYTTSSKPEKVTVYNKFGSFFYVLANFRLPRRFNPLRGYAQVKK